MATKDQRIKALSAIQQRDGHVTASSVVEFAKPKRSPIHDEIEWDIEKAASEYQLSQARRLIRVTPVKIDNTGALHRLVHVPPVVVEQPTAVENSKAGYYRPMVHVVKCPSEYERALRQLQTQMYALEQSVSELRKAYGGEVTLLPTLVDAMRIAKDTIRLMLEQSGDGSAA